MTKRSAMLIAAGLVAALATGATALSFGLASGTTADAETATSRKPIVRVERRTVTVEKEAKAADQPVQVIQLSAPSSSGSADSDDAFEDGVEYEEEHEGEEYEDGEDHGDVHEDEGEQEHEEDD